MYQITRTQRQKENEIQDPDSFQTTDAVLTLRLSRGPYRVQASKHGCKNKKDKEELTSGIVDDVHNDIYEG